MSWAVAAFERLAAAVSSRGRRSFPLFARNCRHATVVYVSLAVAATWPLIAPGGAQAKFVLAVDEPAFADPAQAQPVIDRLRDLGVRRIRLNLSWSSVAPAGKGPAAPAGFDARNPGDPQYRFARYDAALRSAAAAGIEVQLTVGGAPKWAQGSGPPPAGAGGGAYRPDPTAYADFAHAAALRYSGTFADPLVTGMALPVVRYWQAWNEPNLPLFFAPASAERYRELLNGFYDEVKAVSPQNVVVTAGLAPVKSSRPAAYPLRFAAALLCVQPAQTFKQNRFMAARCARPAKFDVFSVHPYSLSAAPGQKAAITGNMFVANVPTVSAMLNAASRLGRIRNKRARLWVTEFAWFTDPPNTAVGDPPERSGVRASEALYRLWRAGVENVTWSLLTDRSGGLVIGGGLLDANDLPKPTYSAFRMPLYAYRSGPRRTAIWGRAPVAGVAVELLAGVGGRVLATAKTDSDGVYTLTLRGRSPRRLISRQGTVTSLVTTVKSAKTIQ